MKTYKIKPLEWREVPASRGPHWEYTAVCGVTYTIWKIGVAYRVMPPSWRSFDRDSLEAAKAAAEAHCVAEMERGLEEVKS